MEDVILPIFPIREALLVATLSDDRLPLVVSHLDRLLLGLDFEVLVRIIAGGTCVHLVGVDDLGLLLEVEGLTLLQDDGVLQLVREIFLVSRA